MKLTNWLMGALAFSMLTACSDSDLAERDNSGTGTVSEAVSGYIAVEIKLPQESAATRADGDTPKPNEDDQTNDKFNDGTPDEYAVKNAMILLFKGPVKDNNNNPIKDAEKKATFFRAQNLTKKFFDNLPTDDQITSSYLAAIDVVKDRGEDGHHFWAMVILNNNETSTGVFEDKNTGKVTVKIGDTEITEGTTFADVLNIKTTNTFLGNASTTKFFMTNAPLSTVHGGFDFDKDQLGATNPPIQYLTDLGTKIYDTPDEAKIHKSGCIYVERAVSKVTYQNNSFSDNAISLTFVDENGEEIKNTDNITISADVQYALTNTNKTSYLIRNVEFSDTHFSWALATSSKDGFSQARMVGEKPMGELKNPFHTDEDLDPSHVDEKDKIRLYRTYWCKDPNYGSEMLDGDKNVITTETTDGKSNFSNLDAPLYCKENTFMVQHQNHKNSTMAIFKITYNIKKDGKEVDHLFIKDGENKKIYLSKESAGHDEISVIVEDRDILNALKFSVKSDAPTDEKYSVKDHLDIDFARAEDEDGNTTQELYVKSIKLKLVGENDPYFDSNSIKKFQAIIGSPDGDESYQAYDKDGKPIAGKTDTPKIQSELLARVNSLNKIIEYTNCVSYYAIPIKHFGDYYTPWDKETNKGTATHEVYNGNNKNWDDATSKHAEKYLGRYGMVRNNWYELNIEEILALGYPTIPDIYLDNNLANDNNETKKYFAVEIHVLSWAKRTQGVKF